ncbi:maleate cis-trans isomerase family protein [Phaeacidiphilus oryzae]|uniref:maleate cis-trans isomerase family protein n=1 Tax=Phaeacidiphilus oryzae TaxID=348818 RepID=UPI00190F94A0|nr:decarboxylase [Phaeacidiphilus oryzae]
MNVAHPAGPASQYGVGIVAPFDFALDRELWRWVPDEVSLHVTRIPGPGPGTGSGAGPGPGTPRGTLCDAVRALLAVDPQVVAYACPTGSCAGGLAGERELRALMLGTAVSAAPHGAVTAAGALLAALRELGVQRVALLSPYRPEAVDRLAAFLAEAGVRTTGRRSLDPAAAAEPWRLGYREVVELARAVPLGGAEALVLGSANLPSYEVVPQLEAELRLPVLAANQVTVWAALRELGRLPVGPYQALTDPAARAALSCPTPAPAPAPAPAAASAPARGLAPAPPDPAAP